MTSITIEEQTETRAPQASLPNPKNLRVRTGIKAGADTCTCDKQSGSESAIHVYVHDAKDKSSSA